jgi:DNA-directed RNA polymerase subunit RPC12/RpoP
MPKIINNKPDPSVVKNIICRNCGVKIEYVPNDIIPLRRGTDYSGGSDGADGFVCPNCKKNIILKGW